MTTGLRFDGVDDRLYGPLTKTFRGEVFTYFIEFSITSSAKEQGANINLGMGFYLHSFNNKIYCSPTDNRNGNTFGEYTFTPGTYKVLIAYKNNFNESKYIVNGVKVFLQNTQKPEGDFYKYVGSPGAFYFNFQGERILKKVLIWDRVLTDLEIENLMG